MSKKEKLVELQLTGITHQGESIGKTDEGIVIFVQGGVPGDKVKVALSRKRKGVWRGVVKEFLKLSNDRITPACQHFNYCGGCSWQNLNYTKQLNLKEEIVLNAIQRIAKISTCTIEPILGCEEELYYRNKLEFTFSNKRWLLPEEIKTDTPVMQSGALGFHRAGLYDKIIDIHTCHLQCTLSDQIRNSIRTYCIEHEYSFYDLKQHIGLLRNLIIKTNERNEALVLLSFSEYHQERIDELFDFLKQQFPEIVSAYYAINTKKNDSWHDLFCTKIFGEDYLLTQLKHVKYAVGPKSFFQTNRKQTEYLYEIIKEYASLTGTEIVFDLYCGVGSIGIFLADEAKKVIGIEEIGEAVEDAKLNARLNNIQNCEFYKGDVKLLLNNDLLENYGTPDLLIVDPPRVGLHPDVIDQIIQLSPRKLIYVSCNPSTAARDFGLLSSHFDLVKLRPVDMFPMTNHIELVSLLTIRTDEQS
ncbi:MAG: 23S rRNA (uracil(1939)-C(5))-methyltransferase RlmD [Saprospiraceae bacterium]|nr:23S rRNA (uracil(1939)-C(5))-methyltransferase RlmD [Saprospiraceae bacterium]